MYVQVEYTLPYSRVAFAILGVDLGFYAGRSVSNVAASLAAIQTMFSSKY